jgi:hypothetical protein
MRVYLIKHKGATIINNITFDESLQFPDGGKVYTARLFFRKKHAQKYLSSFRYPEFFEVVGATVDKSSKDNRKNKQTT